MALSQLSARLDTNAGVPWTVPSLLHTASPFLAIALRSLTCSRLCIVLLGATSAASACCELPLPSLAGVASASVWSCCRVWLVSLPSPPGAASIVACCCSFLELLLLRVSTVARGCRHRVRPCRRFGPVSVSCRCRFGLALRPSAWCCCHICLVSLLLLPSAAAASASCRGLRRVPLLLP